MSPEDIVNRLLYRDGLMLIIDKPAGLAVHRGPKGGASLEDWFDALRFGLPRPPALAHRLDKETSGCLVLGRHRKALADLNLMFRHGKVGKTYWAVVEGGPKEDEGRIDMPLGRLDDTRGWWMKHDPNGLPSQSTWKVLGRATTDARGADAAFIQESATRVPSPLEGEGAGPSSRNEGAKQITWLALEPLTGRTHQLRVHCMESGFPVLGDNIYGSAPRFSGPGLHLHAREIMVPLYKNKPPIKVSAPVPPHMKERLKACGWNEAADNISRPHAEEAATRPSRSMRPPPSFETRATPAPQDEGGENAQRPKRQ
jgi:tRNA pseudouridine32 synthase/23S rRNA pseudouridine746 synthase